MRLTFMCPVCLSPTMESIGELEEFYIGRCQNEAIGCDEKVLLEQDSDDPEEFKVYDLLLFGRTTIARRMM